MFGVTSAQETILRCLSNGDELVQTTAFKDVEIKRARNSKEARATMHVQRVPNGYKWKSGGPAGPSFPSIDDVRALVRSGLVKITCGKSPGMGEPAPIVAVITDAGRKLVEGDGPTA